MGHGKSFGGVEAPEIRERCRTGHMALIDRIVTRLKSVPEQGGTMFDNTMLFYFPDNGETPQPRHRVSVRRAFCGIDQRGAIARFLS